MVAAPSFFRGVFEVSFLMRPSARLVQFVGRACTIRLVPLI